MINLRILYWKCCNICGSSHVTENCPLLQDVEIVRDTFTLSRARLSLPEGLEVIDLVDGSTSVIARNQFKRGVQFGPMIARKTSSLDFDAIATTKFPMKIFSEGLEQINYDWEYVDTSNENLCNWMCLVATATCLEEQNLICFQMKSELFFLLMRDVEPGEQLRVWYAPHYGVQMFAKQLESSLPNEEVFQVHVEEPVVPTKDFCISTREDKKRKMHALDPISIAKSIKSSRELRDRLACKLPSAILGAKDPKSEWGCSKCDFKSKILSEYAKHLITHREGLEQYKCCSCEKVLSSNQALKHHSEVCKSKLKIVTQNETENPKISPSVDELDETAVGRNDDHLAEYDRRQLDHSDMSNVLDSLTDSTPMKKLLLADSEPPFHKEYDIFLDSLTDFKSDSSNIISDSNLIIKIPLKNELNNVDNFTDLKTQETDAIRDDRLSIGAQPSKEMESDKPPILDLGDEIVFQNIKSFTDIEHEVDKNTDFSNIDSNHADQGHLQSNDIHPPVLQNVKSFTDIEHEVDKNRDFSNDGVDSNHTDQGHLQSNDIHPLKTFDKPSKTDQTVDPNDLDLDLLCEGTMDVTDDDKDRLVDNLIKDSEERLDASEINCSGAQVNKNASVTSSMVSGESSSEFQIKLGKNPFEVMDLTLDFNTPPEKIITDKKLKNLDNKSYSCEICDKKFSEPSYLHRHLKKHTGEFTCELCLRVFARKATLANHTCSDVSVYHCELCNCVLKTKRDMKKHEKQHVSEQKPNDKETWSKLLVRKVTVIDQALPSSSNTNSTEINDLETLQLVYCKEDSSRNEIEIIAKKEYVCELCGSNFKSRKGLSYHRLTRHSEKKLTCYVCDKKFHRKNVLESHINSTHLKLKNICPICKMVLSSYNSLRSHVRRHSDQKPKFNCLDCGKTFLKKSILSTHKRTKHKDEKSTPSNAEQATLKSSDNQPPQLKNKRGSRRRKAQNKNEEYICRYCHTILNNRNSLNRHLRVKHQDSRKEWSAPEVLDSMRVVIEEEAGVSVAVVPVSHEADPEPIAAANTVENSIVTSDSDATAIQPSTSDTAENPSNAIANQLCPLDYEFTLKTENNQESDVIGYEPLIQPLNAAELFQLEGNDNTPALILEDSSAVQSGIQLDEKLFYLVFTPEPETVLPV